MTLHVRRAILALASMLVTGYAWSAQTDAQDPGAVAHTPEVAARKLLEQMIAPGLAPADAQATVNISSAQSRLHPESCPVWGAYALPGTRPVGRTIVGVRCVDGGTGQGFVSAEVRVSAKVWVAAHALASGATIAQGDFIEQTADVGAELFAGTAVLQANQPWLVARGAPTGQVLAHPMGPGTLLRASDIHDAQHIAAGDSVKVEYRGTGFRVATEGKTVGAADPGQNVQVRLESGSIVSGTAQKDHIVNLNL